MAACRVQFTWFGVQKSLSAVQRARAAGAFDAEGWFFAAGKKLIDVKHDAFRAVTSVRGRITEACRWLTLPFPEPGVRLIKHADAKRFDDRIVDSKTEIEDVVETLDRCFDELKQAASRRLGSLYNHADYPATLVRLSGVSWDFPNVKPSDLYQQERERVRTRFEQTAAMAEQAFLD